MFMIFVIYIIHIYIVLLVQFNICVVANAMAVWCCLVRLYICNNIYNSRKLTQCYARYMMRSSLKVERWYDKYGTVVARSKVVACQCEMWLDATRSE